MIGWFYSVAGFASLVTRGWQKKLEGGKTVVDASNRFRVVSNVVCDDFMIFGDSLSVKQVPSRLAAPRDGS